MAVKKETPQWEKNLRKGDIFAIPVGDSLDPIKNLHPLEMEILVQFIKSTLEEERKTVIGELIDSIPDEIEHRWIDPASEMENYVKSPNGNLIELKAQLRKEFGI